MVVNLDQGTLGRLSNNQADALLLNAIGRWETASIPTSNLQINVGPDLSGDVSDAGTANAFLDNDSDNINPVIYDSDGNIIDGILGSGNNQGVIGFAAPASFIGSEIVDGFIVLNGRFIDNQPSPDDISEDEYIGTIFHEFGHMLNLDHAQLNDAFANSGDFNGYPTMYPIIHQGSSTPAMDDIAWISNLYPSAQGNANSSFSGTVLNNANNAFPIDGINVVARRVDDPRIAISCVSGFNNSSNNSNGQFLFPQLTPGEEYVIDIEPIDPSFDGGSSVGPVDPPINLFNVGVAEYLNDIGFESRADSVSMTTTFISPNSGQTETLPPLTLNSNNIPVIQVAETDFGGSFPSSAQVINVSPGTVTRVTGTITTGEVGDISLGGDDFEDIYAIQSSPGVEILQITLDPTSDQDIILMDANLNILGASFEIGTANEVIGSRGAPELSTGGTLYILVSNFNGEPNGSYTMEVFTSVSDNSFTAVTGVFGQAPGSLTITGRGFSSIGAQTVTFSDPDIVVNSVSRNGSTQLNVDVSINGPVDENVIVQVTNSQISGGYGGRLETSLDIESMAFPDLWLLQ